MGVVSRRVVPVCGNLCFFCPSLRARSRQPVKRYKKLLADIFPRNQEAELNDRKIGKLCEYASKNPLRIPMITDSLEQRFYKELRLENFPSVNIVVCIYKKLLTTCKEHMPLFFGSLLAVLQALLDQTGSDEMRVLACNTLVDLTKCQVDGISMVNSESLISSLCILGQHIRDNEETSSLPSTVMNALASMVNLMGKHGYISINFEKIISVTLDYLEIQRPPGEIEMAQVNENGSIVSNVVDLEVVRSEENTNKPSYWAMVCLRHMTALSKEATTIRRVLEPMLLWFDLNNQWSQAAYTVLSILQSTLEESGENSHSLVSHIVKHLDHKDVAKKPTLQMDIITVITKLAQNTTQKASVAIVGAISDLMKHMRNSLHHSYKSLGPDGTLENRNTDLQLALENCILQLSIKVGDKGPILDMMAVFMENISSTPSCARSTLFASYRTARVISSIPNVSYNNKAFPDALLYQLLVAMTHSDQKTRVGAHSVLSAVLMPSLPSPLSRYDKSDLDKAEIDSAKVEVYNKVLQSSSFDENQVRANSFVHAMFDGKLVTSLRLSNHQVSLVLSSLWVQGTLSDNMPENFEAMGHTYSIALVFITLKSSKHFGLVLGFQLAFSFMNFSLDQDGGLPASRRRSLFTLGSSMLLFCAMASNLQEIIPTLKESFTEKTMDPFLRLVDNVKLHAVNYEISGSRVIYGSKDDDISASNALSAVTSDNRRKKETVASEFIRKHNDLPEGVLSEIKNKFVEEFSPDLYPLGAPLFMETPRSSMNADPLDNQPFDDAVLDGTSIDVESVSEVTGTQSNGKKSTSVNSLDILSVNELLESVLETARKASYAQATCNPAPYDQIKNQCEALVAGKRHKMSMLQSFKTQNDARVFPADNKYPDISLPELGPNLFLTSSSLLCAQSSFRLPPSTPYDKFLKAAGC